MQTLITGARTPFFATNITYYFGLATGHFSPIEDLPAAFTASQEDLYIKNGFLAKNATDNSGYLYVVTWNEFQIRRQVENRLLVTNAQVLALCTPVYLYLESGGWTMTPVVKVFASDGDQVYDSTVTYINIGTVR